MSNWFNQRNLRSGGESAYNHKSFDERVAETREQHRRKSTADDVTEELTRVEKTFDDLEAAIVDGDDEAAERRFGFEDEPLVSIYFRDLLELLHNVVHQVHECYSSEYYDDPFCDVYWPPAHKQGVESLGRGK